MGHTGDQVIDSAAIAVGQAALPHHSVSRRAVPVVRLSSAGLPRVKLQPALHGWRAGVKRVEDVSVALVALVLLWPLMLLIAVWVRCDSPGPVLFRQHRTGLAGREFALLKFRTMWQEAGDPAGRHQVTRADARVTRSGAFLRQASFDELPQLFNVLRGDMSLVGPRPHAPGTCVAGRPFEAIVPLYAHRHCMRPGITGLAQVRGWRGETETEEKIVRRVACDLEYIGRWSLWLDVTVLARTLGAMLSMKNAY